MTSRRIFNNISNISPTLNSKLILLNRIKNNLPVYNGGLGENPLPTPDFLLDTIKKNIHKKEYTSIEGTNVFQDAVFSRNRSGLIPRIIESEFGFHILQVLDKRMHDDTETVRRQKAREAIRRQKIEERRESWLRRLRDEAYVEYRVTL